MDKEQSKPSESIKLNNYVYRVKQTDTCFPTINVDVKIVNKEELEEVLTTLHQRLVSAEAKIVELTCGYQQNPLPPTEAPNPECEHGENNKWAYYKELEELVRDYSGTKVPKLHLKLKVLEDTLLKISSGRYTDAKVCMAVASEGLSKARI